MYALLELCFHVIKRNLMQHPPQTGICLLDPLPLAFLEISEEEENTWKTADHLTPGHEHSEKGQY